MATRVERSAVKDAEADSSPIEVGVPLQGKLAVRESSAARRRHIFRRAIWVEVPLAALLVVLGMGGAGQNLTVTVVAIGVAVVGNLLMLWMLLRNGPGLPELRAWRRLYDELVDELRVGLDRDWVISWDRIVGDLDWPAHLVIGPDGLWALAVPGPDAGPDGLATADHQLAEQLAEEVEKVMDPAAGVPVNVRVGRSGTAFWKSVTNEMRKASRDGEYDFDVRKELAREVSGATDLATEQWRISLEITGGHAEADAKRSKRRGRRRSRRPSLPARIPLASVGASRAERRQLKLEARRAERRRRMLGGDDSKG